MTTQIKGQYDVEARRWTVRAITSGGRVVSVRGAEQESLTHVVERLEPMMVRQEVLREVVNAVLAARAEGVAA